jgi:hypothetical protein
MAAMFFGCGYVCAAVVYVVVVEFPNSVWVRARAFSASMLSPMGTLFALFVVFISAQVWNDIDRATASVAQEASALRTVIILSTAFPEQSQERLQTLIRSHIEEAYKKEWPMMAHQSATLTIVPRNLVEALQLTLALTPGNQGQGIAQTEMVLALESALDARRQRILLSQQSVSLVKWACLVIQAICVLIAIALSHGDKRAAAFVAMGLFSTGAAACFLLIGAYDRPFTGQLLIRPDPLLQVMPEASSRSSDDAAVRQSLRPAASYSHSICRLNAAAPTCVTPSRDRCHPRRSQLVVQRPVSRVSPITVVVSMGRRNTFLKFTRWSLKT